MNLAEVEAFERVASGGLDDGYWSGVDFNPSL
jgi:hypothetical protein